MSNTYKTPAELAEEIRRAAWLEEEFTEEFEPMIAAAYVGLLDEVLSRGKAKARDCDGFWQGTYEAVKEKRSELQKQAGGE
jgi:hypothetical protein